MDFFIEENTLDVSVMKSVSILEFAKDSIFFESNNLSETSESTFESLISKVLKVLQKIMEAIKKFFDDVMMNFRIRCQQFSLNSKLAEMKELFARKRSFLRRGRVEIFAILKYKRYYSKFIDTYTRELITGLNREFKSVQEYEEWKAGVITKLEEFTLTMSNEEKWKLVTAIDEGVKLTEAEAKNRESTLKMLYDEAKDSVETLQDYYKRLNYEKYVKNPAMRTVTKLKATAIGEFCSKLMNSIKAVVRFITKNIFRCIIAVIAVLVVL